MQGDTIIPPKVPCSLTDNLWWCMDTVWCTQHSLQQLDSIVVYDHILLQMGNNLITSGGAVAIITAINNTDNCEVEELDLTVSTSFSRHSQLMITLCLQVWSFSFLLLNVTFNFTHDDYFRSSVREVVRKRVGWRLHMFGTPFVFSERIDSHCWRFYQ